MGTHTHTHTHTRTHTTHNTHTQVQTVSSERELFAALQEAVRVIDPDILVRRNHYFFVETH